MKYIPILKAMPAEFDALANTRLHTLDMVFPLFEIPKLSKAIAEKKCFENSQEIMTDYLIDTCGKIASVWAGRDAMVDTYHWAPDATLEGGEHVVPTIYTYLNLFGVNIIPVVGYDRWSVEEYRLALQNVRMMHDGMFCIRLDIHAFEDAAEPEFFRANINEILNDLEIEPSNCTVVLDLGDVVPLPTELLNVYMKATLTQLEPFGFASYSIAGCSLPKTIDAAVRTPDSCGYVARKEMLLWRKLRQQYQKLAIHFGDYGIRGPHSNEGIRNKHTNGKIRYTIDKQYYIARGHSMTLPGKGEQMWGLAQKIIDSPHFMKEEFSWGDKQIVDCSKEVFKGSAAQWITIDTCHHIAYVTAEIEEFEHQITVVKPVQTTNS